MEAASEFVAKNLRVVLLPVVSYLFSFLFFLYWIVAAIYIYSIGTAEFKENSPIVNIKWTEATWGMIYFLIFALFWVIAYIICL